MRFTENPRMKTSFLPVHHSFAVAGNMERLDVAGIDICQGEDASNI